jgi:hypothetical protein
MDGFQEHFGGSAPPTALTHSSKRGREGSCQGSDSTDCFGVGATIELSSTPIGEKYGRRPSLTFNLVFIIGASIQTYSPEMW